MCSVTFIPQTRGFVVGMNRDESVDRPIARYPARFVHGHRTAVYPSEVSGGTWIGVNDAGLCAALINWYAIERRADAGQVGSRGRVVPALMAAGTIFECSMALANLALKGTAPFRLIVFSLRDQRVTEWRWDQDRLTEHTHRWAPRHWFSSGFDEPMAKHERGRTSRAAWQEPDAGGLRWLRGLHASHGPARGPFSLCMHRDDAHTVSYSEVIVGRDESSLRYHDGPPCSSQGRMSVHKLFLADPCKDAAARPTNRQHLIAHENARLTLQSPRRQVLSDRLSPCGARFRDARRGPRPDPAHV